MKDGGPAFPQNDLSGYGMGPSEISNGGMTLRDYFVATAPVSIKDAVLACGFQDTQAALMTTDQRAAVFAVMGVLRFQYADAMLKAREQQ